MPNSFLSGFTGGAQLGLRLRDYDKEARRQQNLDRMAQESHATQQQQAGLQMDVLRGTLNDQRQLRDYGRLETEMLGGGGKLSKEAQDIADRLFQNYGGNFDLAEEDQNIVESAAADGRGDEKTRQALNRMYGPMINQGGPKNVHKQVVDLHPTNYGVMVELELTRPDRSTYRKPMTTPNRDEKDTQVAHFPWDAVYQDLAERRAAINFVRGGRVAYGDTAPLTALQTAEAKQAERQQGLEDYERKQQIKSRYATSGAGKSAWDVTSLGDGRFVMYNKQTGERRLPTAEEIQSLGGGGGNVQTVTFTDEDGNKVPMERTEDGWKPIVPEGMESAGVGPSGLTWDQAMERAKAMASERAGLFSRDKTDFGEEGRQGFITRTAQELYQGQNPQLDTAQGQPAPQGQGLDTARGQPRAQQPGPQKNQPLGTAASPYTGLTPEEALRLPPGTYVMDDVGNLRIVPERAPSASGLIDRQGAK